MEKLKLTKKQIDREIATELNNEFTKEDLIKLLVGFNRNHIDLTKWLYDNYREILREYEKTKGNLQIHFLGGKCDSYTSDKILIPYEPLIAITKGISEPEICPSCLKAYQTMNDEEFKEYFYSKLYGKFKGASKGSYTNDGGKGR